MQTCHVRVAIIIGENNHIAATRMNGSVVRCWHGILATIARPNDKWLERGAVQKLSNAWNHRTIVGHYILIQERTATNRRQEAGIQHLRSRIQSAFFFLSASSSALCP